MSGRRLGLANEQLDRCRNRSIPGGFVAPRLPFARLAARRFGFAALALGLCLGVALPAHDYEFSARARILTQLYQLRGFRLGIADESLDRQRLSQGLWLTVWDIGGKVARRRMGRLASGPTLSWHSHLRVDHDFGSYATASLPFGDTFASAIDIIPELADDQLGLHLLYGYAKLEGLFAGRVQAALGRQVLFDAHDLWALDGATLRVEVPSLPIAVEAAAGSRVRDSSPAALSRFELDGTTGADCREYVEGPSPGEGEWRLIDRSLVVDRRPLASDLYICPQRATWSPTLGVAATTTGAGAVSARISYRITRSPTVGIIDEVDRLDFPDQGLYPNEAGQAPSWGTNDEHVAAALGGAVRWGPVRVKPWLSLRASLLHHRVDRAMAGLVTEVGRHLIETEVASRVPTFDGDSIYSVFATDRTTDVRVRWGWRQLDATAWLRRYHGAGEAGGVAAGLDATARAELSPSWRGRVAASADGGVGGSRVGVDAGGSWRARPQTTVSGTLSWWRLASDDPDRTWHEALGSARVSWRPGLELFALHAVAEASVSRFTPGAGRVLLVLDVGVAPEM